MSRADLLKLVALVGLVMLTGNDDFDARLLAAGRDPFDEPHYRRLVARDA